MSQHYARKAWTNHERKSAQARALVETTVYILPARLDATDIAGLLPTTGVVACNRLGHDELAELIRRKLVSTGWRPCRPGRSSGPPHASGP